MVVAKSVTQDISLSIVLDREADVLYATAGWDGPVEGTGLPDGVELDFKLDSDEPCGATIIGFQAHRWPDRLPELAGIIANHLALSSTAILNKLNTLAR